MALILKDRVKETSSTTGTGTLNLNGAVSGFEGFVSAVGNGNTCYYAIQDANGTDWEVGIGTITDASPDTLTRNTILASSNADSVVTLSTGTHTVFLTYPAEKSVYRNANDQVVLTDSGVIFSDSTVQTTAATSYTAGTGIVIDGPVINVGYIIQDNPALIITEDIIRIGDSAGKGDDGSNISVLMIGDNAGYLAKNNIQTSIIGALAGFSASGNLNSTYLGFRAGFECSGTNRTTYIGNNAGKSSQGNNNVELIGSGEDNSILGNESNKVNIGYLITGDTLDKKVAIGNISASTLNPNATLEVISANVNDTGLIVHNLVAVDTGILIASSIPSITTNKLYNNGGTLYFNGNPVDTDTDTTYSAGDGLNLATTTFSVDNTVARSGGNISQFVNDSGYLNSHPAISAASSSNNSGRTYIQDILLDSNGHVTSISTATETVTDTDTTYSAGSGLQLAGTTFNVQDDYLRNDANDTTTGVITSAGISTTGNITGGIVTVSKAIKTSNKSNADSTTITFDLNESNFHTVTLGGNRTLALSNPTVGQKFAIRLQQDATGSRTVTWFSTIRWPDNTVPTLSSTGNKADLFGFVCVSGGQYDGFGIGYNL